MKTTKTIAALSIAMLLLGFSALAGKPAGNPDVQNGNLKYAVTIHVPAMITIPNITFYVLVTDGNNHLIDAAQLYTPGQNTYGFSENGPVTGIRIAWIVQANGGARLPIYDNNALLKGTFLPDHVYQFDIYPKVGKPN